VFELFRIIFSWVVPSHVGGGKRTRDGNVNGEAFPLTPKGDGDVAWAAARSFTKNSLFFQHRTQMALPSDLIDEVPDTVVAGDEVSRRGAAKSVNSKNI
jgi:hypothetical protein